MKKMIYIFLAFLIACSALVFAQGGGAFPVKYTCPCNNDSICDFNLGESSECCSHDCIRGCYGGSSNQLCEPQLGEWSDSHPYNFGCDDCLSQVASETAVPEFGTEAIIAIIAIIAVAAFVFVRKK